MHDSDNDIRDRLLIARLPAMPQILIKLIEHLQADDLGMTELATLIANDPGMTSRILSVATSSAYPRTGRGSGLEHALVALGTDMIKLLVIGESVSQTFQHFPHSASTDLRRFWQHSLSAALAAREVARRMHYPHVEEAYLAGLLHNVGRLALLSTAPQEYAFNFTARDDEQLCAVEQRTLAITHAEAGAWLVERWQLDSFLADAVLYHHEPASRLQAAHPLIRIVRLAHLLASADAAGADVEEALALCAISADAVEPIRAAVGRQLDVTAVQLGVDLAGASAVAAPPAWEPARHDAVQQRLSDDVAQRVLVAEAGQLFAAQQGDAALLEAVARAARILFNFSNAIILVEDAAGHQLVGTAAATQHRSSEFAVPLAGHGALAACARGAAVMLAPDSSSALGLAEQQMLRMLGSDAMACIPLMAGQRCLGVLAGALHGFQAADAHKRSRFMHAFGAQAAAALEASLAGRGHARRALAAVADEYREASRRVAHEVSNPLAIIKNYLGVLDDKLARRECVAGEVSILSEEIDRVGHLINGLAGLDDGERASSAPVGRVVDDVVLMFNASASVPSHVRLDAMISPGCAAIACDAGLLKQVLVNLVRNAIEALHGIAGAGRIEIASRSQLQRDGRQFVQLVVADNGPGLPPHVASAMFAPVRSDKEGANRGLGLSIVHRLVAHAGGSISCRSGADGTAFELLIPASVALA